MTRDDVPFEGLELGGARRSSAEVLPIFQWNPMNGQLAEGPGSLGNWGLMFLLHSFP